jgi:hypothetical protein
MNLCRISESDSVHALALCCVLAMQIASEWQSTPLLNENHLWILQN